MTAVDPIPSGISPVMPFFAMDDTQGFVDFLTHAFDGEIHFSLRSEDGVIRHAVINLCGSQIMLLKGVGLFELRPLAVHLYVKDTDSLYETALAAGAKSLRKPADQFHGSRSAGVEDPFGNHWWLATQIENVSYQELKRREAVARKGKSSSAQ